MCSACRYDAPAVPRFAGVHNTGNSGQESSAEKDQNQPEDSRPVNTPKHVWVTQLATARRRKEMSAHPQLRDRTAAINVPPFHGLVRLQLLPPERTQCKRLLNVRGRLVDEVCRLLSRCNSDRGPVLVQGRRRERRSKAHNANAPCMV